MDSFEEDLLDVLSNLWDERHNNVQQQLGVGVEFVLIVQNTEAYCLENAALALQDFCITSELPRLVYEWSENLCIRSSEKA